MEFIGTTFTKADGSSEDRFVLRCEEHDWFYKGRPPITNGCQECWLVYYTGELAQKGGNLAEQVDKLEMVIRHAAEADDRGEFSFKPDYAFKVENEN